MQLEVDGLITSCTPMISIDLTLFLSIPWVSYLPTKTLSLRMCLPSRQAVYLPS